jgi:hypothetical protein
MSGLARPMLASLDFYQMNEVSEICWSHISLADRHGIYNRPARARRVGYHKPTFSKFSDTRKPP